MKVMYQENVPLSLINEDDREFQPRLDYDEAILEALSKDIAQNGQHNPVGVRKKDSYYQVIYGFQRIIAMRRLGWDTARANIYEDTTWEELHEQSISNNERHLDLGDLEKALYVKALQGKGFSIPRLCELFGVNKSAIYNLLTVVDLDDSTRECLHRRLITLNHAVELARYTDVSKRLETLIKVLSHKFSVRDLKRWMGGSGPTVWVPLLGWIELCPKFLSMVPIGKDESAEEMAKRGLHPRVIEQNLKSQQAHKMESCEECEYFQGLNDDWQVGCEYDVSQLTPGVKKLVEISRGKGRGERNTDMDPYRKERWGRLVRKEVGELVSPSGSSRGRR